MMVIISFLPSVLAENSLVLTANSLSQFSQGEHPFVYGTTTDKEGNPVSDVKIQIGFGSRTILTSTNSTGQFYVESPIPAEQGQQTIIIDAVKGNIFVNTKLAYEVPEYEHIIVQRNPVEEESEDKDISESEEKKTIQLDPFSQMLKELEREMEKQKKMDEEKEKLSKQQQLIHEQRQNIQRDLENDLKLSKERHESHSTRNAFLRFLEDVDSSIRTILWEQFLFTEQRTNHGLEAKRDAIDSGKSSVDATIIFQKEAAVSRQEIMEYNRFLNEKYGMATPNTQDLFNEQGKIPREK